MPSVYVYPLPPELTGEYLYDNITAGDHDFHFKGELELTQRFRSMPQADPATIEERTHALDAYLRALVATPELRGSAELHAFLELGMLLRRTTATAASPTASPAFSSPRFVEE